MHQYPDMDLQKPLGKHLQKAKDLCTNLDLKDMKAKDTERPGMTAEDKPSTDPEQPAVAPASVIHRAVPLPRARRRAQLQKRKEPQWWSNHRPAFASR